MRRIVGRLIMLCVVAAVAVGVAASVASANKPIRGCTKYYTLTPVNPNNPIDVSIDKNLDGLFCISLVSTGNGTDPHYNRVDNTTNS